MKLALISLFIFFLDAASTAMLQITLPQSLSVTEGENVTLPCSFSPPSNGLGHIVIQWFTMPRHYAENVTSREMKKIYQSGDEMHPLSIVKSAGDVRTGNCSIDIPNFPRSLGPVLLCIIKCHRCNAENTEVQEEMVLNVMPAAPRSDGGGVSDATLVPLEEKGGVVAAWVLPVVISVIFIVVSGSVFIWQKRRRSSGLCPHSRRCPPPSSPGTRTAQPSRCGGGNADGPGDVHGDVNGQPLMNGHEERQQQVLETVAV